MKKLFFRLCLSSLIIPSTFFAMNSEKKLDFDKECGIPLQMIYNKATEKPTTVSLQVPIIPTTIPVQLPTQPQLQTAIVPTMPQSLDTKFFAFEQKLLEEFGGFHQPIKKKLPVDLCLHLVQKNIPEIIDNQESIKKFSNIKNTFFLNFIDRLKNHALENYISVTSDTLAIINNPSATQSCSMLNDIPLTLKKFVMDSAYQAIDATAYKCLEFPQGYRNIDFHHITHLAAATHNDTFQMWDLKIGEHSIFPKKACNGWVRFSDNGEQLITALLHQEYPKIIHIDVWDSITKELICTIEHPQFIKDCILHNKPTKQILYIFDGDDNLLRYTIKKDSSPVLSETVETMVKYFYSHYDQRKIYKLSKGALFKKCIPLFVCSKAIQNTMKKESLQNVRIAPLYQELTLIEKGFIEKEIVQRVEKLMHDENGRNTRKSWFG